MCADEVRKMRGEGSSDHAVEKTGKLNKVFISKRINAFRKVNILKIEVRFV
jgi:hypothetical protein